MSSTLAASFTLLILFEVKHFVADFPLQREYMLRKVLPGWEFLAPLALHCLVHAFLTLLIVCFFAPQFWWLAPVDFVAHFIMDRLKSGPRYLGRYHDRDKPAFWNCLGFDQMVHHLSHYYFVYVLVSSSTLS